METFATIFAGLGLFIIGLNGLTKAMRSINSRGLHKLVQSSTAHPVFSALVGMLTGVITQSATAVTFIVVSMVSSGMIGLLQGLFITAWSNIGTASLVLVAMLDIHLFLYLFIGLLGASYYLGFDKKEPHNVFLPVLVSIAVLMLGLMFIKQGSVPIKESELITTWLGNSSEHVVLLMFIGLVLTLIMQSASSTSAIVVSLVSTQLFDFYQACSLILGANLGAGISVYLIGRHLLGSAKKVVVIQALNKFAGVLILIPLFSYEFISGQPILSLMETAFGSTLVAITVFVFVIQVVGAVSMSLFSKQAICLVNRLVQEDMTEETRKPKYLHRLALDDTESALDLLVKEQYRVISFFPNLLDGVREESHRVNQASYADSVQTLIKQCDAFCLELINTNHHSAAIQSILRAKERNELLFGISRDLVAFVEHAQTRSDDSISETIRDSLLEGLHFVLMYWDDVKNTAEDVQSLLAITDDKSAIMQRAREALVNNRQQAGSEMLSSMLATTSQFERLIWQINSYCKLIESKPLS